MNELSCEICRDLMPLVIDGVVSPESAAAVEAHLTRCEACKKAYGQPGDPRPAPAKKDVYQKVINKLRLPFLLLWCALALAGLMLSAEGDIIMIADIIIMPVLGVFWYGFNGKHQCWLPALLLICLEILTFLLFGWYEKDWISPTNLIVFSLAPCILLFYVGFAIIALFCYGLRRER